MRKRPHPDDRWYPKLLTLDQSMEYFLIFLQLDDNLVIEWIYKIAHDGNCGCRALAKALVNNEHEWPMVQTYLADKLIRNKKLDWWPLNQEYDKFHNILAIIGFHTVEDITYPKKKKKRFDFKQKSIYFFYDVDHNNPSLENARENSEAYGVAPSEILGIDETTNTATWLRNRIFEIGESSRVPINIDDNMDSNFEFNINPLIHETWHYLGNIDIECPSCHALHWLDEKLTNSSRYRPLFGTCCKQGKIRLPILQPLLPAMQVLYDDDSSYAKLFQSHIHEYNTGNAFTNLRVKLDDRILSGRGPKLFAIYGELKHRVGALLPDLGKQTAYAQPYIYDSASALNARVTRSPQLNTDILKIIQDNLMEYNPFV
ncbi:hypothetical protein GIB67_021015 [Kingdonia uniflora]|uniref:Uncharacterized protein n=1 Tax=Kingdonia uniflora TaxID=39325 RepID=A0A7J7N6V3_9MAGN|nr:hypothetical protein GIB67_021015 [Kingdonia uniflora]